MSLPVGLYRAHGGTYNGVMTGCRQRITTGSTGTSVQTLLPLVCPVKVVPFVWRALSFYGQWLRPLVKVDREFLNLVKRLFLLNSKWTMARYCYRYCT